MVITHSSLSKVKGLQPPEVLRVPGMPMVTILGI